MPDAFTDKRPARFLENRIVPVADVRDVLRGSERAMGKLNQAAPALAYCPTQAGDFVESGETARHRLSVLTKMTLIGIGRKAKSAGGHALVHQLFHFGDLGIIGFALDTGFAHRVLADGAMANQGRNVQPERLSLERIEEFSVSCPRPRNARP